jgi:hypothetical protein
MPTSIMKKPMRAKSRQPIADKPNGFVITSSSTSNNIDISCQKFRLASLFQNVAEENYRAIPIILVRKEFAAAQHLRPSHRITAFGDSFWADLAGGVDLIRPAAVPLEAASRLISGKLSADDPKTTFAKTGICVQWKSANTSLFA